MDKRFAFIFPLQFKCSCLLVLMKPQDKQEVPESGHRSRTGSCLFRLSVRNVLNCFEQPKEQLAQAYYSFMRDKKNANLNCLLASQDAAASLSTWYACQSYWSSVCYNNIFQQIAVQVCCCLPKQESKSLELFDSPLESSSDKPTNTPSKNTTQKNKRCAQNFGISLFFFIL